MNVEQLIERLQEYPGHWPVSVYGRPDWEGYREVEEVVEVAEHQPAYGGAVVVLLEP